MFADLITSKSRVKLLQIFLSSPHERFHVRDLVRKTSDEINAVRRELSFLERRGVLAKEPRANRVYYQLSKTYPFFTDFLTISAKTVGLGAEILANKLKLGKIKHVMFSGKFLRNIEKKPDDVDLLVVGTIVLPELALLVRNEEKRLGREINYTVMTEEELDFRKKKNDPFINRILSGSRLMLIGDEEALLA